LRLGHGEEHNYGRASPSPLLLREAKDYATRWLTRFAPFLDGPEQLGAQDCRDRLALTPELRAEGEAALASLEAQATPLEAPLLETLRTALGELEHRERDLRRRLAYLAPGDPQGEVDLTEIQARLAEAQARREVESLSPQSTLDGTARLELQTSPGNRAAAVGSGIMGAGVLAFTTVHAIFMIGGMMMAFGPLALFMLAFYAIFWFAAYSLLAAAYRIGSRETVELAGRELTVRRQFGPWKSERKHLLGPHSRAHLVAASLRQEGSDAKEATLTDDAGGEIRLASGRPELEQERLVQRLNEYLAAQR